MYRNFITPYLYEAQYVSGDTPPIIRSLKLHWQPLVFHMWKVVGRLVGGRCKAHRLKADAYVLVHLPVCLSIIPSAHLTIKTEKRCRYSD
jgi:hypothetical protein